LHYISKDPTFGELVRVLSGLHAKRPQCFDVSQALYAVFFPLSAAASKGIVEIVGHVEVPQGDERPRLMRRPGGITRDGRILNWFITDGANEWRKDALSDSERELSIAEIWNDTLLIERITSGWRPRDMV
jgi:hypothetical protein